MDKGIIYLLILSKCNYVTIDDCPEEVLKKVICVVKKVSASVKKICEGYTIVNNNYPASGQAVDHIHFHIVPRFKEDGLKHWFGGKYDDDMEEYREKIKID